MGGTFVVRIGAAVVCAGALAGVACMPAEGPPGRALAGFLKAVQGEDLDSLYCLCAGASASSDLGRNDAERRAKFDAWAREELDSYLDGREAGQVELNGHGLRLVKLFALGRGTFYSGGEQGSLGRGEAHIATTLRFGYAQVNLSGLSPGTTFYLSAAPVGRVHAVRVPSGPREINVDVLDTVTVDWTLVRTAATAACPAGWTVRSAEPRAGSLTTTDVTWVF